MSQSGERFRVYGANVQINLKTCFYCRASLDDYDRTVDHLIPESRGGIRANSNKVPACGACNRLKGDMTPDEFKRALCAMIKLEVREHKKRYGYLRKIEISVEELIASKKPEERRNDNKTVVAHTIEKQRHEKNLPPITR